MTKMIKFKDQSEKKVNRLGFLLLLFFVRGDTSCFPRDERDGISFITITSVGVGKS